MTTSTTRRALPFDGFGYVNNLGGSKYWGVSPQPETCITHDWRIRNKNGDSRKNESNEHLTSSTVLTEKQCAWIAAFFYENPDHPLPVTILDKDGVGEFRIGSDRNVTHYPNPITPSTFVKTVMAGQPVNTKTEDEPALNEKPKTLVERAREMFTASKTEETGLSPIEIELLHTIIDYAEDTQFSERFKKMANAIFEAK